MTQNNSKLINHIFMLVDSSGSMGQFYGGPGEENVKKIFKSQIEEIKEISVKMGQETRASLYTFSGGGRVWERPSRQTFLLTILGCFFTKLKPQPKWKILTKFNIQGINLYTYYFTVPTLQGPSKLGGTYRFRTINSDGSSS